MNNLATTLLFLIAFAPVYGQSQNPSSAPEELVELVSANAVSTAITVHTYKLNDGIVSNSNDENPGNSVNSTQIQEMTAAFLAVNGVTRCTFDKATRTFTILTNPTTDLTATVNELNAL